MQKAKIGMVSFDSLGDSLLYVLIAENLRLNGFDICLYSNVAYQIRAWMPQLQILPLPSPTALDGELEKYDLAIVSPPQYLREKMSSEALSIIRQKWVLICHRAPDSWKFDLSRRLEDKVPSEVAR